MKEAIINENINNLIDLFNNFNATFNEEKQKLFSIYVSLCDNANKQNDKIESSLDMIKSFSDTYETKLNNVRLSILKINQSIDSNTVNENNNFDILNNKISNLEKQIDNQNKIIAKLSIEKDVYKKENSYIYKLYIKVKTFILMPYISYKKKQQIKLEEQIRIIKEREEYERKLVEYKLSEEKRIKEEENRKRQEKEAEELKQQQIKNILSNNKRKKEW